MLTAKTFTAEMLGKLTGANILTVCKSGAPTDRVDTFMRLAQKAEELRLETEGCFSGIKRFKPNAARTLQRKLVGFNLVVRLELTALTGLRKISSAEREKVMETAFNMLNDAVSALNRKQDKVAEYHLQALVDYFFGKAYPWYRK